MAKQTFTTGQVLTAAQMTQLQQTAMLGGAANAQTASYVLVAGDAGNCVSMSNAGATTITVNTGIFAAGDIVTILNIGAGTCTITAGTATVSKPTNASLALVSNAGGVLYFTATGTAIFLPFDTGGASGLTLINRTSFSNVASQAFDNVFTSTYSSYLIVAEEWWGATATANPYIQLRYAGPTTQAANYFGAYFFINNTGTTSSGFNNGTNQVQIWNRNGSSSNPTRFNLMVNGVGNASERPTMIGNFVATYDYHYGFTGFHQETARTYTGFILSSSSGNITGTVAVYGLAK